MSHFQRRDPPPDQDADGHAKERPPGEPDPGYGKGAGHPLVPGCQTCSIRRAAARRGLSVKECLGLRAPDPACDKTAPDRPVNTRGGSLADVLRAQRITRSL